MSLFVILPRGHFHQMFVFVKTQKNIRKLGFIRNELLDWYQTQKRDLPWRKTGDPYAIWISEIMLQQTRVETVIPYYLRFLERFPSVKSLAHADLADVLSLWSGLGYYRRARHLHAAAVQIVSLFSGRLPDNYHDILSLMGIGRYTAGAVLSIAFGLEYPVVDGNVHRVFARLFCIEEPRSSTTLDRACWEIAERLIVGHQPGDLNQALMELGAVICTPRTPTCMLCPVRDVCQAFEDGDPLRFPQPRKKKDIPTLYVVWGILERKGKILLVRRPEQGLFGNLWELPGLYTSDPMNEPIETLTGYLKTIGVHTLFHERSRSFRHLLSHRRLSIHVFNAKAFKGRVHLPDVEWRWVTKQDISSLGISSITRKVLQGIVDFSKKK